MSDPFGLQRFVEAQDAAGTYERALSELRIGRKRSHWMWFVFPQLAGLGHSATAQRYAIGSLAEARAYLAHPLLGPRPRECAQALLDLPAGSRAVEVLGAIAALKLRSSMTLFAVAAAGDPLFRHVLDRYWGGMPDETTERLLSR